jgi:hypothetical protein
MRIPRERAIAVALAAALLPLQIAADGDPGARALVEAAFRAMFDYPSVRSVRIRIYRGETRVTERAFDVVYKRSGRRGQTLLRFTEPEYLRGTTLLVIEAKHGWNDIWLYQPERRRPRRVGAGHRRDPFFGSDLTFEDLEHHDWQRYAPRRLPDAVVQGRPAHVVEAIAPETSQYAKVVASIERERSALLRLDLYAEGSETPVKAIEIPAEDVVAQGDLLLPRRMWVRQIGRAARTEVIFERIRADPDIADRVFETMRLERSGEDLYELVERLRSGEGR